MISKKLLSEVLNKRCSKVGMFGSIYIEYTWMSSPYYVDSKINIYELAHKCKKWAYDKGWLLQVRTGKKLSVIDIFNSENRELFIRKQVSCNTEPEAIFKALKWIVETEHVFNPTTHKQTPSPTLETTSHTA